MRMLKTLDLCFDFASFSKGEKTNFGEKKRLVICFDRKLNGGRSQQAGGCCHISRIATSLSCLLSYQKYRLKLKKIIIESDSKVPELIA